jgi:hypothetical protein
MVLVYLWVILLVFALVYIFLPKPRKFDNKEKKLLSVKTLLTAVYKTIETHVNEEPRVLNIPDDELVAATIAVMLEERLIKENILPQLEEAQAQTNELFARPAKDTADEEFEQPEPFNKKPTYH